MININKTAIVPYSTAEMYELVNAVEDYPKFLPWCQATHILHRDEDEVRATLDLVAAGFTKSFTTSNRLQKNKMIEICLIHGPFRHLEGFWRFDTYQEGVCKVSLDLEFEFANQLLSYALNPVFHQVVNTLVDAFCERAVQVYGKRVSD